MEFKIKLTPEVKAEVLFAIGQFPYSYRTKLPKEFMDYIEENYSLEHYNKLDQDKPFTKQDLSADAVEVLGLICEKYFY